MTCQMSVRSGVPIVLSAPSGGGKTTIARRVIDHLGSAVFSISHTTRPLRGSERDGIDYHFVDDATFDDMVSRGAFLEWASVHGKRYGTARGHVAESLSNGLDVFFDIDVQGGRQIVERLPGAVLVFLLPPNMQVLEQRLRGRGTDHDEQIGSRLAAAKSEIEAAMFYPYWIVNDSLEHAVREMTAIVVAERIRRVDKHVLTWSLTGGAP